MEYLYIKIQVWVLTTRHKLNFVNTLHFLLTQYTEDNICKMIEFLIDNIFVQFGGCLFHQVIGIPVGTSYAALLPDLFLYSYKNEFLDNMIIRGHRRHASSFDLCC